MSITENKNKTKNIIEKKIISAVVFAVWSVSANKCSFSPHKEAKVKTKGSKQSLYSNRTGIKVCYITNRWMIIMIYIYSE